MPSSGFNHSDEHPSSEALAW